MTDHSPPFPIVGIGASAGGIPAMEGLFRTLPADPGVAFVIVTHLSPDRESKLHEIIERYTKLPVKVAENDMPVEVGHVYVMPSNAILTIAGGCLNVRRPDTASRERKPVDIFLSSLAEDVGEYAVAIILSGGDGDGTLGAKVVKERGGFTLAQAQGDSGPLDPGMPESAIGSGVIDVAVPVSQMGEKILEFRRSAAALAAISDHDERQEDARSAAAVGQIYSILQSHTGHDFSGYKIKTFMRRVRRRMHVLQLDDLDAYVATLVRDADQVMMLFRDLLINVTNFFRDPEAFDALEKLVIPRLFRNRDPDDAIRVWIPACATGEEVYSIAILMREQIQRIENPPRVQIFATDIDEAALSVARAARYPGPLLEGMTPERRDRFFTQSGSSFVLSADVRDLCVFSPHSVIRDPPFSRMDMVSCRNLLIYLGADFQNRVFPTFHYALKPDGYLFLGTSESINQHGHMFTTIDKKSRIFQAREHLSIRYPLSPVVGATATSSQLGAHRDTRHLGKLSLRQSVEAIVVEKYAPAHVIVDAEGNAIYYSARTGKYLEPPQGAPSRHIVSMARRGLRLDLRTALREAVDTRGTVVRDNVMVGEDDDRIQPITLIVEPMPDQDNSAPLYMVLFDPAGPSRSRTDGEHDSGTRDETARLEQDLSDTRERLQSTIEEYETAIEELKSSNEELISVNEEAQSSNEELEASKEEMQSLNEELSTINLELNGKLEELDHANGDLRNLFESSRIATVFLDRNLVIRNFTPAASSFFNLRPNDIGRPLTDLSSTLDYPELRQHLDQVFVTGKMVETRLARDQQDRHFLVRLLPYRSNGGRTEGVVVTLLDVTTLAEAEEHQQVLIAELNHRVKNMLAVVVSIVNHTMEHVSSKQAFADALVGRLHAMARGYSLLSRSNWKDASIRDLLTPETEAFGPDRFTISGPDVRLKPQPGISVGMVLHELATNAAKYGALSDPGGRVEVSWNVQGDTFTLHWHEHDGPKVTQPTTEGFGLFLIKGEIGYRLSGKVETDFAPDGVRISLSFGLGSPASRDAAAPGPPG